MKEQENNYEKLGSLNEYLEEKVNSNISALNIPGQVISAFNSNPGSSRRLGELRDHVYLYSRSVLEDIMNEILNDNNLYLIASKNVTNHSYPTNVILSPINLSQGFSFNEEIKLINENEYGNRFKLTVHPRSTFNFIYNLLIEDGNNITLGDSGVAGTNIRFEELIVVKLKNKELINVKDIDDAILKLEKEIKVKEEEIEVIKDSLINYNFLSTFMKGNDLKSENFNILKSKMIMQNLKDEDSDKDDASLLTAISDIIDLKV